MMMDDDAAVFLLEIFFPSLSLGGLDLRDE